MHAAARLVETAYRAALTGASWLDAVLPAAQPLLELGRGVVAFAYDLSRPSRDWLSTPIVLGADAALGDAVLLSFGRASDAERRSLYLHAPSVGVLSEQLGRTLLEFEPSRPYAATLGVTDFVKMNARTGEGRGVFFCAPSTRRARRSDRRLRPWPGLVEHLGAAARLREAPRAPDAVLSPDGRLLHAEGAARGAGDVLRRAVRERGRRSAVEWPALVDGRWSIVESMESGGRTYVMAIANAPHAPDPRRLTPLEMRVARRVAEGDANKAIAIELGIAEGTVASHVHAIAGKLGVERRVEIVRRLRLLQEGERRTCAIAGLSLALIEDRSGDAGMASLSAAEYEVASLAAQGATNREIASARRVALRTVANQLASVFAKLGVDSRAELAAIWR